MVMSGNERKARQERRAQLDAKAHGVLCVKCGAQPGEPCISSSGKECKSHEVRIRHASYLPIPR